jgi:hypothetical protein
LIVHHHHEIGLVEHRLVPLPEFGMDYPSRLQSRQMLFYQPGP